VYGGYAIQQGSSGPGNPVYENQGGYQSDSGYQHTLDIKLVQPHMTAKIKIRAIQRTNRTLDTRAIMSLNATLENQSTTIIKPHWI
jgi:hypothetical protein